MRTDSKPFPTTRIKGSWKDMGIQYGQDLKKEILFMIYLFT